MNSKISVVFGATGQDGSYLIEFLLSKLENVIGVVRRSSTSSTSERIVHLLENPKLSIIQADLCDFASILKVFNQVKNYERIEVYNLAAQSQVHVSFGQPEYTTDVNAIGPLRILECVRSLNLEKKVRIFQASTSELFGDVCEVPQKETTTFNPKNPYAAGKLYAHTIIKNYRDTYGIFACNGILFSHESERRGMDFVTRKITHGINKIYSSNDFFLSIGNIYAKRDWGYSKDYVRAMYLMLQHETPGDYVISSEETHTVKEFIEEAFICKGHSLTWSGEGLNEIAEDESGRIVVRIDPKFYRPTDVTELLGDSTKARNVLGWSRTVSFKDIIRKMIDADSKL